MMLFSLNAEGFPTNQVKKKLAENRILINRYAEDFFLHPAFSTEKGLKTVIAVMPLKELGLEDGATLNEIIQRASEKGYKPCAAWTGVFLRLHWTEQPESSNTALSGQHRAPDKSVTVLSELLETDDSFPKGLYLRHVDGSLWLRGYICNSEYRFSSDDLFAFDAGSIAATDPEAL